MERRKIKYGNATTYAGTQNGESGEPRENKKSLTVIGGQAAADRKTVQKSSSRYRSHFTRPS